MRARHILIATVSLALTSAAACQVSLTPQGDAGGGTIPVNILAYRPDGSLVLFTEPAIHVFDGALTSELTSIPLAFPITTPSYAMPQRMRFSLSSDGTTAAVSYSAWIHMTPSTIEIFSIPDGQLLNKLDFPDVHSISTPSLSPDGKLLYAMVNTATMFDTATGATLWTDNSPDGALRLLPVWSTDGKTLFSVRTRAHKLDAVDARTGTVEWEADLDSTADMNGDSVLGLAVAGNGSRLAGAAEPPPFTTCKDDGDCSFFPYWSTADGTPQTRLPYVPDTGIYESTVDGTGAFACDATDTCVVGLRDFSNLSPSPCTCASTNPTARCWSTCRPTGPHPASPSHPTASSSPRRLSSTSTVAPRSSAWRPAKSSARSPSRSEPSEDDQRGRSTTQSPHYWRHTPVEVSIFQLVRHVVETVVPVMVNGSQM